jgi:hypothetical protein
MRLEARGFSRAAGVGVNRRSSRVKSLFGVDIPQGAQWLLSLAIILALIGLMWLVLRSFAGGRIRLRGQNTRGRQPRLGVVDIFNLDRQRQLVLIRRDNVEHLILVGGGSDTVIESNIQRSGVRAPAPGPVVLEAAPEAAPFAPAPHPSTAPAPIAAPAAPVAPPARMPEPARPPEPPKVPEPVARPPERPLSSPRQEIGRQEIGRPEIAPPSAPAASKPLSPPPLATPEPRSPASTSATPAPAPVFPAPPASAPTPASPVAAKELQDMTRQLEEALKKPFAAVRPAGKTPPTPEIKSQAGSAPKPDPAGKPAEKAAPRPEPKPRPEPTTEPKTKLEPKLEPKPDPKAELRAEAKPEPKPEPKTPPKPEAAPATTSPPASARMPAPPAAAAAAAAPAMPPALDFDLEAALAEALDVTPAADPAPLPLPTRDAPVSASVAPPAAGEPDPFSLTSIEAEFARLLGRAPDAAAPETATAPRAPVAPPRKG